MSNMSNNNYRYNTTYDCELLAPAGSTDAFMSAINAGADAIYMGGTMFGARAFADNPDEDALISCINYAHLRGCKVYLTVNTLLKNSELKENLYNYLLPYYKAGLDAVIVQDFGVLRFIKSQFPDLPIHASTQMTIYSKEFAEILKEEGVSRVVTPRELSFNEIKLIKESTNLEIESFVHGALCYCYSGQCLFSSIAGNRSGNRGRCAQPCRMPYSVNNGAPEYILSPKDLCTLDILPDIIESGVYSLKIEGRMKKPEYVSAVVSIYRKYIDYLKQFGRAGYKVLDEDRDILNDIYNRGNFTQGYYKKHNGKDMITLDRPNHTGVNAFKVKNITKKDIEFVALRNLNRGDVIEISEDYNITLDKDVKKGAIVSYKVPKDKLKASGPNIFNRVRNNKLIDELNDKYLKSEYKIELKAYVEAKIDSPLKITVNYNDIYHLVEGEVVLSALNKPTTTEMIKKMVNKTGNTPFRFSDIEVVADDNIFVNVKDCNELRRRALEEIEKIILSDFSRDIIENTEPLKIKTYNNTNSGGNKLLINCMVTNKKQFDICIMHKVDGIYLEMTDFAAYSKEEIIKLIDKAHKHDKAIYLALPYVFREEVIRLITSDYEKWCFDIFDALLVRNLSEYRFFKNKGLDKYIFDYNVYAYNDYAIDFLDEMSPEFIAASLELDSSELKALNTDKLELMVYGNFPLMTSAQCVRKTKDSCLKIMDNSKKNSDKAYVIKDRLGNIFMTKAVCFGCYNLIYNNRPLSLLNKSKDVFSIAPKAIRLIFVSESDEETNNILNMYEDVMLNKQEVPEDFKADKYTKGHFKRRMD